jgi:ribosomal protein S18 acetylase RimI-like enzyme|nr:GNAT family N-acetyltransferase [uncultured Dongia sp.]
MPRSSPLSDRLPELLSAKHSRAAFNSGNEQLDNYLKLRASQDAKRGVAVPYVIADDESSVVGYYTLSSTSIDLGQLPPKLEKKLPAHAVLGATLLGRMAVDVSHQRRGLGSIMIAHALDLAFRVNPAGSIAVVVDAIDAQAVRFYEGYGFFRLPEADRTLYMLRGSLLKYL